MYGVLTAVLGRDLLAEVAAAVAHDPGDPLLTAAILHWNAYHVPLTDAWWQFPIFHPTRSTLAFSEHLLGVSVVASPLAWLTGDPLTAYNLTLLLTFPMAAMAMYALVHRLTASAPAAFLAGLAFGFAPYRMSTLAHIQMLTSFWAPLALLGLHGYMAATGAPMRTRVKWLALFAAAWALQGAANGYALVYFSVLVGLWVLWFIVARGKWRALGEIAAAMVVAALALVPILSTYVAVHAVHGFERSLEDMRTYSADVAALLCAPQDLTFWGWIRVSCRGEGELFPGVALFALFVAGVYWTVQARAAGAEDSVAAGQRRPSMEDSAGATRRGRRSGRAVGLIRAALLGVALVYAIIVASILTAGPWQVSAGFIELSASDIDKPFLVSLAAAVAALLLTLATRARSPFSTLAFYLFAAVVMWLFALGPTITFLGEQSGRSGPFMLLQVLPGVGGLRVPARFWLMAVTCLAVAGGMVLAEVVRRGGRRVTLPLVIVAGSALLADGWIARIPAVQVPQAPPDAAVLRGNVVLQLPMDPFSDIAATWRAVTGGWRSVNGYSGYAPNYYEALRLAAERGEDAMFRPFQQDHQLHVVVAEDDAVSMAAIQRQGGAVLTGRGGGLSQYRLPRREARADPPPGDSRPVVSVHSPCTGEDITRLIDGDERTSWECPGASDVQEVTLDLGSRVGVGAILYSVGAHSWNVPAQLAIDTSIDGVVWEDARSGSVLGEFIEGGLSDSALLGAVLRFPPRTARYVRIRPLAAPAGSVWWITELEVRAP